MDHSLIKPNQLRHYGVVVHDYPCETDPTRAMGIEINDNNLIPFSLQGSTVFFNSLTAKSVPAGTKLVLLVGTYSTST